MLYLEIPHMVDPHVNLAIEEFLLRHIVSDEPVLFFYVNTPSVIVGRNQNVFEEIDLDYVREQGIPVVRRLSGGGTVYHDLGNLNFSLISPEQVLLNKYDAFTRPVVDALWELGIAAELRNRSSIFVGDKKISGNAQYATAGKLVSHGTLLFDTDLDQLRRAIKPRHGQIESRAVQSVRSSIVNLRDLLDEEMHLGTIREHIRRKILESEFSQPYALSEDAWKVVKNIAEERYHSWSWNIGRSPKFSLTRRVETPYGSVTVQSMVDKGYLQESRLIENDPEIDAGLLALCDCVQGVRYDPEDIAAGIANCEAGAVPSGLTSDMLLSLFY